MLLKHSCCQLVFKTKKNSFVSHLHLMSRWPKPAGVYPRPFTKAFKLGDRRYVDEDHIRIIWTVDHDAVSAAFRRHTHLRRSDQSSSAGADYYVAAECALDHTCGQ